MKEKQILDPACGSKMFWFDKNSERVLFCDNRKENHILCDGRKLNISPDKIIDFCNMPFKDHSFNLVVFDPPHFVSAGPNGWMNKKYGTLNSKGWREYLKKGFSECWRVLNYGGTLIFKWNETRIKLSDVLPCFNQSPLFGQTTTQNLKTHWIVFYKQERQGN